MVLVEVFEVVEAVFVGVVVKVVERVVEGKEVLDTVVVDVVLVVVDVVMGASVQLALPVLQPLQLWNGSISCVIRRHLWLSAM